MSTSKKRKKRPDPEAIDRPFAAEILRRARIIAADYQVVMWFEDGDFYGRGVELPGTMDDGRTPDECMAKTREAFVTTVAYLLEVGEVPPPPASDGVLNEHISMPVSSLEALALSSAAEQHGYRNVGAYLRELVLTRPAARPVREVPPRRRLAAR